MAEEGFTGLSTKRLNQVLQSDAVLSALRDRSALILPRARAVAFQAGAAEFARELRSGTGTRPGTGARDGLQRTYGRIYAVMTPEQRKADQGASLTRRQILRRAAHGA